MRALTFPTPAEGVFGHHRERGVGVGRAHAKAIVLGEHAVVYGAPALALPVPQLTVTATAGFCGHSTAGSGEVSFTMTGSPSRAVGARAPLYFRAGRNHSVRSGSQGLFVIADSGVAGSTRQAVTLLRDGPAARPGARDRFVTAATALTEQARHALAAGRLHDAGAVQTWVVPLRGFASHGR